VCVRVWVCVGVGACVFVCSCTAGLLCTNGINASQEGVNNRSVCVVCVRLASIPHPFLCAINVRPAPQPTHSHPLLAMACNGKQQPPHSILSLAWRLVPLSQTLVVLIVVMRIAVE
jgi:hypothetical protein